ncbi:hypothetical protein BDY19DRAFT_937892 [Irpex rosettiformis]|uniref:Uncharacterized protein n=1 Tax=Irpex rosettiformis TaxID=378272 RepID=A0ACB8UA61_9APHY|nr:hypothetical protein BDY19DRAFT_937892 [Irpex rosettiformis]
MFFNTKLASFAVLAAAVGAQAQSSSAAPALPSGLSSCATGCLTSAVAASTCQSIADLACICTDQQFLSSATACLTNCGQADLQAGIALQQQECANIATSSGASGASSEASSTAAPSASLTSASGSGSSVVIATSSGSVSGSATLSSHSSASHSGSAISGSSGTAAASTTSSASRKDFGVNVNAVLGAGVAVIAAIAGAGLVL